MKNKPHIPKTWKNFELKVAKDLGGERNPLSGRSSKHCYGDVIHPHFVVSVKYNQHLPTIREFEITAREAKKAVKNPIVVLKAKGQRGYLYVVDGKFFRELARECCYLKEDIKKGE